MEIIIHHNEWTKDPSVLRVLQRYSDCVSTVLPLLSKRHKFQLPDVLNIKTFQTYNDIVNCAGRCRRTKEEGYSLIFNPEYCPQCGDSNLWVVEHEIAHLAAALHKDYWGHKSYFKRFEGETREAIKIMILAASQPP